MEFPTYCTPISCPGAGDGGLLTELLFDSECLPAVLVMQLGLFFSLIFQEVNNR